MHSLHKTNQWNLEPLRSTVLRTLGSCSAGRADAPMLACNPQRGVKQEGVSLGQRRGLEAQQTVHVKEGCGVHGFHLILDMSGVDGNSILNMGKD